MLPFSRRVIYPVCLLTGALLTIVAGTLHPHLVGDGAAQLPTIAQCAAWRPILSTWCSGAPVSSARP